QSGVRDTCKRSFHVRVALLNVRRASAEARPDGPTREIRGLSSRNRNYLPLASEGPSLGGLEPMVNWTPVATIVTPFDHICGVPSFAATPRTSISSPSLNMSLRQPFRYKPLGGGVSAAQFVTFPSGPT